MTQLLSPSSLRRLYLEWVEEQIEDYKDAVPRSQLIELAEQVVADLEVSGSGQYQLTELLLLEEVDRKIVKLLKLPGYRAWSKEYLASARRGPVPPAIPLPVSDPVYDVVHAQVASV